MSFQAITAAPFLREGISLSFMAIPQRDDAPPAPLTVGADVSLRLGNCCPSLSEGRIIAVTIEPPRAVLSAGGTEWVLERGCGDATNAVPGIKSEVWCIRQGNVLPRGHA